MAGQKKALLLVHRIPYPPDKGDKIRSWRLFSYLAARFDLSLGCFIDDPADWQHLAFLESLCAQVKAVSLSPGLARLKSLRGLASGAPLSFPYYSSRQMHDWVAGQRASGLDLEFAFSSAMAPYLAGASAPVMVDLCDADSAKWAAYAKRKAFPMSLVYEREARCLAKAEAEISRNAATSWFITQEEAALVKAHPDAAADKIDWYMNGVDTDYFDPAADFEALPEAKKPDLVFTGAMDYWANVDAVLWFMGDVWPALRERHPALSFAIVGARPAAQVQALANQPGVSVTGRVDDVRPWVNAARLSLAPLQIARGVQNKVLEAMALATPVVASPGAATGIRAEAGQHFAIAQTSEEMVTVICQLLDNPTKAASMGRAGRQLVVKDYGWEGQLARLGQRLAGLHLV